MRIDRVDRFPRRRDSRGEISLIDFQATSAARGQLLCVGPHSDEQGACGGDGCDATDSGELATSPNPPFLSGVWLNGILLTSVVMSSISAPIRALLFLFVAAIGVSHR